MIKNESLKPESFVRYFSTERFYSLFYTKNFEQKLRNCMLNTTNLIFCTIFVEFAVVQFPTKPTPNQNQLQSKLLYRKFHLDVFFK